MSELSDHANSDWVSSMQDRSLTRFMEQLLSQTSATYGSSKSSEDESISASVVTNGDPVTTNRMLRDLVTTKQITENESANDNVKSVRKKRTVKQEEKAKSPTMRGKLTKVNRRKRGLSSSPEKPTKGHDHLRSSERSGINKIKLAGGRSEKVKPVRTASVSDAKTISRNRSKTDAEPKLLKEKAQPKLLKLKKEPKMPKLKSELKSKPKQLRGKAKPKRLDSEKTEPKLTRETTELKQLNCEECQKVFKDLRRLNGHRRVAHSVTDIEGDEERKFTCKLCKQKFRLRHHLYQHLLAHEGNKRFACTVCDRHYTCISNLNLHIRMKHDQNAATFTCTICSLSFNRRCSLVTHELSVHGFTSLFTCSICSSKFTTTGSLSRHMMVHTGEMGLSCPVCSQPFRHQQGLKYHYMRHHSEGEKPYKCNSCPKSFATPVNLRVHSVVHSGIVSFHCTEPDCGKTYRSRQAFKTHLRLHAGEQSFKCDTCNRYFRDQTYLRRHQQRRHDALDESKLKYVCSQCNHVFFCDAELQRHVRVHNGVRPFACKLCPSRFTQMAHLQGHEAIHANLKSWKCKRCGRGFNRKDHLKLHVKTMRHDVDDSASTSQNGDEASDQNTGAEMIQVKFDADGVTQKEQHEEDMIE